ncbi:MAG: AMP-binding protein [Syntrophaceae bacterium]|nr:AMP-binding protein [Syntrophaceae bacterium]
MVEEWYRAKEKDIQYPRELVLGEILRRNAERYPDRPAVVYRNRRHTYEEFNARVNRMANSLITLGIKKGDCIGVFAHNSDCYVEAAMAIAKAGGIFIPINFRLVGHEVEYILTFNEAVAVFVDAPLLDVITGISDRLRTRHVIVMRSDGALPPDMLRYEGLLDSAADREPDIDVWEGDLVGLAQTGGTTGRPKGVLFSHRHIGGILYQICFIHNYREEDHGLHAMPSYSSAGIAYDWGATLFHGGTLFIAPLPPFDPVGILEIIDRERINHMTMAPIMIDFINAFLEASPGKYDVSSVRTLVSVGAPTPQRTREKAVHLFGPGVLYVEYSATEMGVATCLKPNEVLKYPGSCGRTALGQEVKIIDMNGRDLPRNQVGEICVAGPMVTRGYNKNPEANRQAFHDRFMGIGDMGYMDDKGYVYIVDRKSDMIISGGMNIYPAEIEAVMIGHPVIAEIAVIGVPDEKWGESVKAIIRLEPGKTSTAREIIEWCRGKMAGYRIPKSVDFVDDFPRTAIGKVQKSVLRKKYRDESTDRTHPGIAED